MAELIKRQVQTSSNGLDKSATSQSDSKLLQDLGDFGDFGLGPIDPATESVINSVLTESMEDAPSPNPDVRLPSGLSSQLEESIERIKKVGYV